MTAADDLDAYLDAMFGDTEGYLHASIGVGPYFNTQGKYKHKLFSGKHYRWPEKRRQVVGDLLAAAEDSDAYLCPYLMVGEKRSQGAAAARRKVHADFDGHELNTDKAREIDACAVGSGTPGHAHVYVILADSVPAHWHRALCQGLGKYLGDADAKISDNDVLRPPGTLNHKARIRSAGGEPTAVEWLIRPTGTTWDPEDLAAILDVTLPAISVTGDAKHRSTSHTEIMPVVIETAPMVKAALEQNTGDRSADTMRIVGACKDSGLTLPETRWVIASRSDLAERLDERPDDDVLTCWLKAVDSRQTPQCTVVAAEEFGTQAQDPAARRDNGLVDLPRLWDALDLAAVSQPRWLATGRIPRAAITLLVGDEGIGKSLLWVWLVAYITTGRAFPKFGIPARDPADVIIVITEDVWSDTVRPRLEVAKADMTRIRVICTEDDGSGAPVFPRDLHLITAADPAPAMVIVDAWLDTVPSNLSVKDPQQARIALHPWKEVATITGAAVMLLTHTNRVATANARDRYGITGELRKKARMTLFAQAGEEDGQIIVGPEKMNTARPLPASVFTIKSVQFFPRSDDHDGTMPELIYAGESELTAREHLAENMVPADSGDDAVMWLAALLASGPRWATEVFDAAKTAGISEKKARTAKRRLNVDAARVASNGPWFWRLPQDTGIPDGPQMAPARASGHLGHVGSSGKSHISPPISQDSLIANGETQGHLDKQPDAPVQCEWCHQDGVPPGRTFHWDCERISNSDASNVLGGVQ